MKSMCHQICLLPPDKFYNFLVSEDQSFQLHYDHFDAIKLILPIVILKQWSI